MKGRWWIAGAAIAAFVLLVGGWIISEVVGGVAQDYLPSLEDQLTVSWAYGYIAIFGIFAVGFVVGCIAYAATQRRMMADAPVQPPPPPPDVPPVLQQLQAMTAFRLNREAVQQVIAEIVDDQPNHKVLCRQILTALASGETDILSSDAADWKTSGLNYYGRMKLQRTMRVLLLNSLRGFAIPSLQGLEEKLRTTRVAIQETCVLVEAAVPRHLPGGST